MSKEAVAKFFQQIKADPAMLADLKDVPDAELPARMVAAGRDHGHDFSADDVRAMMEKPANDAELSDEALTAVAGGSTTGSFGNIALNSELQIPGDAFIPGDMFIPGDAF